MKMAFVVHNEFYTTQVMDLLKASGIDYYTRWEHTTGKGHGTEPHLGRGGFQSVNSVLMIAFEDEGPLDRLIDGIVAMNAQIKRRDDHVRLFQMPLDRIV